MTTTSTSPDQLAFNVVYFGLAQQDFVRAVFSEAICVYRNNDGCKCAVGHLLPDAYEIPVGLNSASIVQHHAEPIRAEIQRQFGDVSTQLLWELQLAHDGAASPLDLKHRLHNVARAFELSIHDLEVN